jgi:hypothetical protein
MAKGSLQLLCGTVHGRKQFHRGGVLETETASVRSARGQGVVLLVQRRNRRDQIIPAPSPLTSPLLFSVVLKKLILSASSHVVTGLRAPAQTHRQLAVALEHAVRPTHRCRPQIASPDHGGLRTRRSSGDDCARRPSRRRLFRPRPA